MEKLLNIIPGEPNLVEVKLFLSETNKGELKNLLNKFTPFHISEKERLKVKLEHPSKEDILKLYSEKKSGYKNSIVSFSKAEWISDFNEHSPDFYKFRLYSTELNIYLPFSLFDKFGHLAFSLLELQRTDNLKINFSSEYSDL